MKWEKRCFKCGETKMIIEFYKHKYMSDGHLNKCKSCARSDSLETRAKKIDYYRSYDRKRGRIEKRRELRTEYSQTLFGYTFMTKAKAKWSHENREKRRAHLRVARALSKGLLNREPCRVCGSKDGVEAHHPNYSQPLHVIWLCDQHHKDVHVSERNRLRGHA